MADVLYFAYGSNMLRERLARRCPRARAVGPATLKNHRLTFDKFSTDGSGKGAYESAQGERLFGVLWALPETELPALDRAEGVGHGYERVTTEVVQGGGEMMQATTYRATDCRPGLRPYDWYLDLVIAGAEQQGLPDGYIDRLRATPSEADVDLDRHGRAEALEALRHARYVGAKR